MSFLCIWCSIAHFGVCVWWMLVNQINSFSFVWVSILYCMKASLESNKGNVCLINYLWLMDNASTGQLHKLLIIFLTAHLRSKLFLRLETWFKRQTWNYPNNNLLTSFVTENVVNSLTSWWCHEMCRITILIHISRAIKFVTLKQMLGTDTVWKQTACSASSWSVWPSTSN